MVENESVKTRYYLVNKLNFIFCSVNAKVEKHLENIFILKYFINIKIKKFYYDKTLIH